MSSIATIAIVAAAALFCLGVLLFGLYLIPALKQLRTFLADAEKTSLQIREICLKLEKLEDQVGEKIDKADALLYSTHKVVENTGDAIEFINQNILKKSAFWLAFLPALRLGWKFIKKIKR